MGGRLTSLHIPMAKRCCVSITLVSCVFSDRTQCKQMNPVPIGKNFSDSRRRLLTGTMHSSEQAISKHPMIDRCVMFGKGRPHPGLVVEPSREYAVDIKDGDLVSEYVDAIW